MSLCYVGRKSPPPQHAAKLEKLKGFGAPVQQRGHVAARVELGEVKRVPTLKQEAVVVVAVVGRHPGAALVEGGVGMGTGWRDCASGGAHVDEALNGTRMNGSPS